MNKIQTLFQQDKAKIAYLTAGDGGIQRTLDATLALIEGGVNCLEIGMPFSDPIADGPVIQRAAHRALQEGTCFNDLLWLSEQIRKYSSIPLILFTYLNPFLAVLSSSFLSEASQAGINGLLIVDSSIEFQKRSIHDHCLTHQIAPIYVITSSTHVNRAKKIAQYGSGFLYYACRKGTTGIKSHLPDDFIQKINTFKSMTDLPIVVGFGVSQATQVEKILSHADGVVIGSRFVHALEQGLNPSDPRLLAQEIFNHRNSSEVSS
jgi:tryptophan synthase alpha chain